MTNDEKFEAIEQIIKDNAPDLPEKLSEENIVKRLNTEHTPSSRTFSMKKAVTVAASLIVIISAVLVMGKMNFIPIFSGTESTLEAASQYTQTTQTTQTTQAEESSEAFESSYNDIIEYFEEKGKAVSYNDNCVLYGNSLDGAPEAVEESAMEINGSAAKSYAISSDTPSHSDTNNQVDEVDEADILENDGTYFYYVKGEEIVIIRAEDLEKLSTISLTSDKKDYSVQGIFVSGDRLVVTCNENELTYTIDDGEYSDVTASGEIAEYNTPYIPYVMRDSLYSGAKNETVSIIYDITDRKAPKKVYENTQSGYYNTSRLVGEKLYTISLYSVFCGNTDDIKGYCIPKVNGKKIPRNRIEFDKDNDSVCYTVITCVDIKGSDNTGESYAKFGDCDNTYCDTDTLYLTSTEWSEETFTTLSSFELKDGSISKKAQCKLNGELNNQYSMDEYNGNLRIVMTNTDNNWVKSVNIIVLDSSLKKIGEVKDIAGNEDVQSVRFMGDTAYVVTYMNTDPLFIIDLSNPKKPVVAGEVKLPGFSSYLHSVSSDYLIGIGYDGDESSANFNSVKVTLFDVSNPQKPKVADEVILENTTSATQYNFKSFMYYPEKNLIGFPCMNETIDYEKNEGTWECFYALVKIDGDKLEKDKKFTVAGDKMKDWVYSEEYYFCNGNNVRGAYIGEKVYVLSEKAITAYNVETGERIGSAEV